MAGKRSALAEMTAGLRRWLVRVAMDDAALAARGSVFALLKDAADTGTQGGSLLLVRAIGMHHFNALDALRRACLQQRIWSAVLAPLSRGEKQLAVYVPRFSSVEAVETQVTRLAVSFGIQVAFNAMIWDPTSIVVIDALVESAFMHEIESLGCQIVGNTGERQVVVSPGLFTAEVSTIIVPQIQWEYNPHQQLYSLSMACIPVVMKLTTIAEDQDEDHDQDNWLHRDRARVFPRFSECWVVSRTEQPPKAGSENVSPQTEDDFRQYWLRVHGIQLPRKTGGYVRVRFSGSNVLTYPACCVATAWVPLYKQTRREGLDILRELTSLLREIFGGSAVSITSPDDQPEKSCTFLPALAYGNSSSIPRPTVQQPTGKRRMISRGRYIAMQ